jgi:hypothetical protein
MITYSVNVCRNIFYVIVVSIMLPHRVCADSIIYDTSETYNTNIFSINNGEQLGNEITLSPKTWSMTGFNIEYYSTNILQPAQVGVDLRFYNNNGKVVNGIATPGTEFYDSGWDYGLTAGPQGDTIFYQFSDLYQNALLNLPAGFLLPGTFTFTVTFTNLNAENTISLPLANSPTNQTATSYGTYWVNTDGQWSLLTNSVPANLVAQIIGTTVPEPTTAFLGALGSLFLFAAGRLVRRR